MIQKSTATVNSNTTIGSYSTLLAGKIEKNNALSNNTPKLSNTAPIDELSLSNAGIEAFETQGFLGKLIRKAQTAPDTNTSGSVNALKESLSSTEGLKAYFERLDTRQLASALLASPESQLLFA